MGLITCYAILDNMLTIDDIVQKHTMISLKKRKGWFKVSDCLFDEPINIDFFIFMGNFLVIRAEHHWGEGHFIYHAISTLFSPVDEGCIIPEYTFKIEKKGERLDVKAIRVSDKGNSLIRALRKIDV